MKAAAFTFPPLRLSPAKGERARVAALANLPSPAHPPKMLGSASHVAALFALFAAAAATSPSLAQVRSDGAQLLPVAVPRGSLQNPCCALGGARLVLTWFSLGYNQGGAGLWLVEFEERRADPQTHRRLRHQRQHAGPLLRRSDRRVVFSSDPEGPDQAYLVPFVGGALRQITRPPQIAWEPTFSPDGKWIVFESHRNGPKGEIWKVRVDGTGLTRLSFGVDDRQPNWGPANRIVFPAPRRQPGRPDVMDAAGGNKRKLTNTPPLEETDVSWSPSGGWLVFSSDGPGV